ncbi:hypothetical protein BJ085DRAFT_36952 [Dimargaris cristalligena]|uniref:Uncharacterized protein n=1 Tax=Dimargaris cristalligena TaxID=215637 RepID=A0A4Q0A4S3_9FUNG|nr:hypothetical protein BJ085DRAFT_36952 [Dimargaris cristalligena]|eukprot:RKP40402.1 hypothetical protein BJ085DRAFT_36952 [Dimargaris cristalligena]
MSRPPNTSSLFRNICQKPGDQPTIDFSKRIPRRTQVATSPGLPNVEPASPPAAESRPAPPSQPSIKRSPSPVGWGAPTAPESVWDVRLRNAIATSSHPTVVNPRKAKRQPAYVASSLQSSVDDVILNTVQNGGTHVPQHNLAFNDIKQLFLQLWDPFPSINICHIVPYYKEKYGAPVVFPYAKLGQALTNLFGKSLYVTSIESASITRAPIEYPPPENLEQLRRRVLTLTCPPSFKMPVLKEIYTRVYGKVEDVLFLEGEMFSSVEDIINYALDTATKPTEKSKFAYDEAYFEPLLPSEKPRPRTKVEEPNPDPITTSVDLTDLTDTDWLIAFGLDQELDQQCPLGTETSSPPPVLSPPHSVPLTDNEVRAGVIAIYEFIQAQTSRS